MSSTDDIDLFVDNVVVDMNPRYENSNILVRVKVRHRVRMRCNLSSQSHCLENALMNDLSESSDTLHAFNVYKPS